METIEEHRCHGGTLGYFRFASEAIGLPMNFAVFLPEAAARGPVPALYCLAGLTCNHETFLIKAGAPRFAAQHGLALVACDTSPRGAGIAGEDTDWDFGTGAGFYLDATAAPWSNHYRMATHIDRELPALVEANFPIAQDRRGVTGHSMGGHGALVTALRDPDRWRSVSAFAPIAAPMDVPWGQKAFTHYLGLDQATWADWDATRLMRQRPHQNKILVDIGEADPWLASQLRPESLEEAARASGQALALRRHPGYDHSYWFIQSVIEEHLAHHAALLAA